MSATRQLLAAAHIGAALALSACGGSGSSDAASASTAEDREAARVRLQNCLRDNGVELPDGPGQGGGPQRFRVDRAKLEEAMKACEKYRKEAFGDVSEEDRQEFRDAFTRFAACMREHGVDIPDPGADGPGDERGRVRIDGNDPKFREAREACEDKLPEGGRGGLLIGPGGGG